MTDWGTWGSAAEHERYAVKAPPRSRRRCHCGCNTRATHVGMANGVALTDGCHLWVRRWVRDGNNAAHPRDGATPPEPLGAQ